MQIRLILQVNAFNHKVDAGYLAWFKDGKFHSRTEGATLTPTAAFHYMVDRPETPLCVLAA